MKRYVVVATSYAYSHGWSVVDLEDGRQVSIWYRFLWRARGKARRLNRKGGSSKEEREAYALWMKRRDDALKELAP